MKRSISNISKVILSGIFLFLACVRQFDPEFREYEDILVVEGVITNESAPQIISLTRSYPLNKSNTLPETGAIVDLVDDSGRKWRLTEFTGGVYRTDTNEFMARTGEKYMLHIFTKNGEEFESQFAEVLAAPEIDSLSWEYTEPVSIQDGTVTQGVEFFISTHNDLGNTRYYNWELFETWEFRVPFVAENMLPNRTTCWKNDNPEGFFTASSELLAEDRLIKHPFYFISGNTNRLGITYSLQVKQYALSKESYEYMEQLKKINFQQGSLYDAPPAQMQGNIKNLTYPDKPVLGYFMASGVTTYRIFVKRNQLPDDFYISGGFSNCTIREVPEIEISSYLKQGFVLVSNYYNTQMQTWMAVLTNSISCVDCTVNGSNSKPPYWPQ